LLCFVDSLSVLTVNDENETLGASVIMSPQRTNLVLTSDVPNVELDILVCDRLDVESDGWYGCHGLVQLELVKNGRLAGSVEAKHEEPHFLVTEDAGEGFGDVATHGIEEEEEEEV